jgi:hypothetical protein
MGKIEMMNQMYLNKNAYDIESWGKKEEEVEETKA